VTTAAPMSSGQRLEPVPRRFCAAGSIGRIGARIVANPAGRRDYKGANVSFAPFLSAGGAAKSARLSGSRLIGGRGAKISAVSARPDCSAAPIHGPSDPHIAVDRSVGAGRKIQRIDFYGRNVERD